MDELELQLDELILANPLHDRLGRFGAAASAAGKKVGKNVGAAAKKITPKAAKAAKAATVVATGKLLDMPTHVAQASLEVSAHVTKQKAKKGVFFIKHIVKKISQKFGKHNHLMLDFEQSKHPRDKKGRWASKNSAQKAQVSETFKKVMKRKRDEAERKTKRHEKVFNSRPEHEESESGKIAKHLAVSAAAEYAIHKAKPGLKKAKKAAGKTIAKAAVAASKLFGKDVLTVAPNVVEKSLDVKKFNLPPHSKSIAAKKTIPATSKLAAKKAAFAKAASNIKSGRAASGQSAAKVAVKSTKQAAGFLARVGGKAAKYSTKAAPFVFKALKILIGVGATLASLSGPQAIAVASLAVAVYAAHRYYKHKRQKARDAADFANRFREYQAKYPQYAI